MISDTAARMGKAAKEFLASLSDEQRSKVQLDYDDPARFDWHNIPKPQRKGIQIRDMTPEQRELCHVLLRTGLSDVGYDKAVKVMALENNLHEGEKHIQGGHLRDPQRFFLTIFGEPKSHGDWGWSFEGHHLSLNFAVSDGKVIGVTPFFWGANPATVKAFVAGGPEVGTRTLADEEQLAIDLVKSLDGEQRAKAIVADKAPADYRAAGQPEPPDSPPIGIKAVDLTPEQQKLLRSLLQSYSGNLAPELATGQMAEVEGHGFENIHFAWFGPPQEGIGHAFRVQGPTFLLELVNIQSDPEGNPANHIHSVWRDLDGDFGSEDAGGVSER